MSDAGTVGNVRVDLEADWGGFRDDCERAARALGNFGTQVGKVAVGVGKAGLAIASAGAALAVAFVAAGTRSALAAEQLNGRFNSAFGDMADTTAAWATQFGDRLGYTTSEIKGFAAEFQDLFGVIAPTSQAAATASMHFTQLAADFAALKNIDLATSVDKIRAAITTGGKSMQQYGVDLSDAAVNARGLEEGLITQGQTLSETAQQLVRAQILTEALAHAQGEAKKEVTSLDGQFRKMRADVQDAATALGKNLVPAITVVGNLAAWLVEKLAKGVEVLGNLINAASRLTGITAAAQNLNNAATSTAGKIEDLGKTANAAGPDFIGMARGLDTVAVSGRAVRSWAERHKADIDRIRESYDQVGAALRQYTEDMAIAQRAGLDMVRAQQALAGVFLESVQNVKELRERLAELPAPLRELAEGHLTKLRREVDQAAESFRRFVQTINEDFGPKSAVELEMERLHSAFQQGAIDIETYRRAKEGLFGGDMGPSVMEQQADAAAEAYARVQQNIEKTAATIADAITGTRSWGDTIRQTILEFLKAKWITPFLENLMGSMMGHGMKGKGGGGGILGGVGQFIGGLFGQTPMKKASGGNVLPGMPYEVGERGRELFVPSEHGSIVPAGQYGRGGTVVNVYTQDAGSFLRSRRQVAQAARREIGV